MMQLLRCICIQATIHGAGHSLVSDIIDFEQSEDGMMISYGVCEQLDDMKHTYHGLPDFLTKVTCLLILSCHPHAALPTPRRKHVKLNPCQHPVPANSMSDHQAAQISVGDCLLAGLSACHPKQVFSALPGCRQAWAMT